jgi:O-antigen/teichoic acid export membrane protein
MKKNIIANLIGKFWSILSNFLFIPFYISILGFESFSIISFSLIIAGLMAILDGGLTAPLSREFALQDNILKEKIRIFKTLESTLFIIIGLSIFLIYSLSDFIANNWLNLSSFNPSRISFFLKVISFDIGFQFLFRFYMGGLLGLEKQIKANIYQIGWGILRNGLIVIGIWLVPSLEMFFIWQTLSTILFAILIGLSLKKELTGHYNFDFQFKIEISVFRKIWRFAAGMLLITVVAGLNTQMDKLAISKFLPIENLGYYTLAVSLSMGIIVLVNPISIALLPRFTALFSLGDKEKVSLLYQKVNLFVVILSFTLLANLMFFAKELIWIWTGKMELAAQASIYLPIIAISFAMLAIQIIPYNVAIANGYTKLNNVLGLTSLIVTLPGYWIATKYFGAIGAAYVFCGVQSITTLIYIYLINKKFLEIKNPIYLLYVKQMLLPLIISLSIAFIFSIKTSWALQNRFYAFTWIGLSVSTTFLFSLLLLFPLKDLKRIVSFRKI